MFQSLRERLGLFRKRVEAQLRAEAGAGEGERGAGQGPGPPPEKPEEARLRRKKAKAAARAASAGGGAEGRPGAGPAPAPPAEEKAHREGVRPPDPFTNGLLGWKLSEARIDSALNELEMALLESDVALPVVERIRKAVKDELLDRRIKIGGSVGEVVESALRKAIMGVLSGELSGAAPARAPRRFDPPYFSEFVERRQKPVVIMFVGINGTGKTTTIAKLAHYLMKQGYSCVIGAGDTFRAGAIEQLEKHAERLGVKLIKHQPGSDPASVAYDAIEHARARRKDVVLVDTAGRMQTDAGLMEEMTKIERVARPDLVVYVGDALAGNDAVNEASAFNRAVGIDAVVLTKVDADAKGGAALSIRYATGAPVIFVGTGQGYDDLQSFSPAWMVERIFGGAG
ncbi:MAG: signal recognition particle-docking protein FtsY [Thermoplasmatota archaeon]